MLYYVNLRLTKHIHEKKKNKINNSFSDTFQGQKTMANEGKVSVSVPLYDYFNDYIKIFTLSPSVHPLVARSHFYFYAILERFELTASAQLPK